MFPVFKLGKVSLDKETLREDKKNCRKIGPVGLGDKALYLNSFYIDRLYYVPIPSVRRVFKRVAMSKGGFTGKGLFASIPYLVVEYDSGEQKQCNFKYEEKVDQFLALFHERYPKVPIHSVEAEKRLHEKQKALEKRFKKDLSPEVLSEVERLQRAERYLEAEPELAIELSAASRAKRVNERSNPAYKWVALVIVLMGFVAVGAGIRSLLLHDNSGIYFLLFGLAAVFLFSGANVLPTRRNNRRAVEERLREAQEAMAEYVKGYGDFPVPAYYAHPGCLSWMGEILREGRAKNAEGALEVLKKDLASLNSSVTVEQDEYERIMSIKPMFLVRDYQ